MSSRILTVILETKYYQSSIPIRKITYSNSAIELTDAEYDDILLAIPAYWHTENDKLIRFVFFDDKTYLCERQKNVFDYTTRETISKIYKFDYAPNEEAEKLYKFFIQKYGQLKVNRIDNLYDKILTEMKDMSFIKYSLIDYRDNLLKESDYIMLSDYPISTEEKEKWITYRQELRDITQQEAWVSNHIMDVKIPVSPQPVDQLNILKYSMEGMESIPDNLTEELISSYNDAPIDKIVKDITQISLKFELIKTISRMRIPILSSNQVETIESIEANMPQQILEEMMYDDNPLESMLPKDWWESATSNIDKKIEDINNTLKQFNIDFTIGDILDSVVEKVRIDSEADQLINDLMDEENVTGPVETEDEQL